MQPQQNEMRRSLCKRPEGLGLRSLCIGLRGLGYRGSLRNLWVSSLVISEGPGGLPNIASEPTILNHETGRFAGFLVPLLLLFKFRASSVALTCACRCFLLALLFLGRRGEHMPGWQLCRQAEGSVPLHLRAFPNYPCTNSVGNIHTNCRTGCRFQDTCLRLMEGK